MDKVKESRITPIVAPSALASDWSTMRESLSECERLGVTHIHFDVMDGNFVPTISFGPKFVADARKWVPSMFFDVHLMVKDPSRYIETLQKAGANACTFHIEEERFSFRCLEKIAQTSMKSGVALNPQTPIECVIEVLPHVDIVLIMSVDPGFGGQSFLLSSLKKIKRLCEIREKENLSFKISVDGGINEQTAIQAARCGADILVMGSAFFSSSEKASLLAPLY